MILLVYICRKWKGVPRADRGAPAIKWVRPLDLPRAGHAAGGQAVDRIARRAGLMRISFFAANQWSIRPAGQDPQHRER